MRGAGARPDRARRRRAATVALLLLCASGCEPPASQARFDRRPAPARVDPAAVGSIDAAAAQIRRCYRPPRVAHDALQIATRLHVRFAPDGTLATLPEIVAQSGVTPANQAYAGPMGEAAILSVIRCVPLKLPAEAYAAGWQEFDLTFSPKMAV